MRNVNRIGAIALLAFSASVALAAGGPHALASAAGGLWSVSADATGHNPEQICVSGPEVLSQWEHRGGRCTRVIISDEGNEAVIHYTCADGGFGHSKVSLITPRTLRIDTQGISAGLPFHYLRHARRMGDCQPR